MKQSVITGKHIFARLSKLHEGLNELGKACDLVSDEIGSGTATHNLLMDQYKEKKEEIGRLERESYTISQQNPFEF